MIAKNQIRKDIIVTTSVGHRPELIERAISISLELNAQYVARHKAGLPAILKSENAQKAVVVETNDLVLAHLDGTFYRYHPNLGLIRALNLLRGQRDLFADSVNLKPGDSILDCTIGFGCEAILAAILVGETGRVVGLESVPELALITKTGLAEREMKQKKLEEPMRRVEVQCADYTKYIDELLPDIFDVIYFDPFFGERIEGSEINIDPLKKFGNHSSLDVDAFKKAIQLAGRRVVLKHPRDEVLPGNLETLRTSIISRAHGPIAYSVFEKS